MQIVYSFNLITLIISILFYKHTYTYIYTLFAFTLIYIPSVVLMFIKLFSGYENHDCAFMPSLQLCCGS